MKIAEKTIVLKNGQMCLLRCPAAEDAEEMLVHLKQTCDETPYMARYADEIVLTVAEEREHLTKLIESPCEVLISACVDGALAASAGFAVANSRERLRHRAEFGISVKRAFWNTGVGSALMNEIIEAARQAGYEQIELEVVTENERAVALYRKFGFEIYGTRKNTFKYRDGSYLDCHLMLLAL